MKIGMGFLKRLCVPIFSVGYVATAYAINVDRYIGPLGSVTLPMYSTENSFNSPVIPSSFRTGFRVEAGSLADNLSFDFRFNSRNNFTDFGFLFRNFFCWGMDESFAICPGIGLGVSFSPGFVVDPAGRSFADFLVNSNIRWMWDVGEKTVFVVDTGLLYIPSRTFSTDSPVRSDSKAKLRGEITLGFLSDFVEVGEAVGFGSSRAAQGDWVAESFLMGFKGGFSIAKFTGTSSAGAVFDGSRRTGMLGGVTAEFGGVGLGLIIDILYGIRRFGLTSTSSALVERIEAPLLLRYRTEGASFLMASAGGFVAQHLGPAAIATGNISTTVEDQSLKLDYGYALGIGIGTAVESVTVTLELRAMNGVPNLVAAPSGSDSKKTRAYDLLIGFLY
jgi:hypothetical protein